MIVTEPAACHRCHEPWSPWQHQDFFGPANSLNA
jgi:hypothetical protein